jgi:hypothetical protein
VLITVTDLVVLLVFPIPEPSASACAMSSSAVIPRFRIVGEGAAVIGGEKAVKSPTAVQVDEEA